MALLHLVRHGHAAAGWGTSFDPGLDELGQRQAEAVAARLAGTLEPCALRTSPLARARETAQPLERSWGVTATVDPAFGEIPSPTDDLRERAAWLSEALAADWDDLGDGVAAWRRTLLDAVSQIAADTVVFTHFVAINAVVGWATGERAATVFLPANASVTTVEIPHVGGVASVVALGGEATAEVG